MPETAKVGECGQVTVPKRIREQQGREARGEVVIFQREGSIHIEKLDLDTWVEVKQRVCDRRDEQGQEQMRMEEAVAMVHRIRDQHSAE